MAKPDEVTRRRREKEDARVVAALREAGVHVESVYDLVNDPRSHEAAVGPLLEMLPRVGERVIRAGVVRALTDPAARGIAARPLVEELRRARDTGDELLGWAIGNALEVVADESVLPDLLGLALDARLGRARQTLAEALGRFKGHPEVVAVLVQLLKEEEVAGHAIIALRKLRAKGAWPAVEPFLEHPKAWVRREAKKARKILA